MLAVAEEKIVRMNGGVLKNGGRCWTCGAKGHMKPDCPTNNDGSSAQPKIKEEISHADTAGSTHGEGVEVPLRGGEDAASPAPSTESTPKAALSESEGSEVDPSVPFDHGSYGPRAKPPPAAWLAAKAAAAGDGGAEAPLPKIHPVPAGDGGAEAPLPKIHPVPQGDDDDDDDDDDEKGKGKGKGHRIRGKPSSEAEVVLKAKGIPVPPLPPNLPSPAEASSKEEPKEEPKEESKEEVKEESKEMIPREKHFAEMKRRIAEFQQGYGTSSSTASPVPKEAAYRALPGTAPRPKRELLRLLNGHMPRAVPTEVAG